MGRTLIDRVIGWLRGPGRDDDRAATALEDLARTERSRRTAIEPDTRRQWQVLRNTITASRSQPAIQAVPWPARLLRPVLVTGIAASLMATVFLLWHTSPVTEQRFGTGRGQMSTIALADSSDVILNHTSEVHVLAMAAGKPRSLELNGEAFFKVRKNGSPFRVVTSAGIVEVLGTEFNVRQRPGAFEVAVVSGRVRVSVPRTAGERLVELTRGMILTVAEGDTAVAVRDLQFSAYPGWLHDQVIFQDRPLASVCEELEDRFDVHIRITRSQAGRARISGTLESRSADRALISLAALTGLSLRHEADAYVLY